VEKQPLVFVEWIDSHSLAGWQNLDSLGEESLTCRSVGWLIHDGEQVKVIAPHLSDGANPQQGNGIMMIPAKSVIRTVTIPEP
jgi:hypothetical protein